MLSRYATFTSCTNNYRQYLTAQLNSMAYHGHADLDVHVLVMDMEEEYLSKLVSKNWPFQLFLHRDSAVNYEHVISRGGLIPKKTRYKFVADVLKQSLGYGAILFLDVDLMFAANIMPFLELVSGTPYILGCNERFKWNMSKYTLQEQPLPDINMHWMICNAPMFMPPLYANDFWGIAWDTALNLRKVKDGQSPSDLYTMNVALWRADIHRNVIPLPNYAWTGVHNGYVNMYTRLEKKGDRWQSVNGEPVYMIHGRWDKPECDRFYLKEQEKRYAELGMPENVKDKHRKLTKKTFQLIKDEFARFSEL